MITHGQKPTDMPASPSPRATTAQSGCETQSASPDVVDVTGVGEPWTVTSAKRVSDHHPLHTSTRAASKLLPDVTPTEARKRKKKVIKRAIPVLIPTEPEKNTGRALSRKEGPSKSGEEGDKSSRERKIQHDTYEFTHQNLCDFDETRVRQPPFGSAIEYPVWQTGASGTDFLLNKPLQCTMLPGHGALRYPRLSR
ncbi:hypothetical protein PHMEG_00013688 [Phytophthora megakarya]|uniref:Uncharacterized protein n=1 Tax=Phytophthora megakarya TaxID=4795 RepID=A0A225W662_9STRA|nr:hypothetical protein PHMEG_00013688 [Phytophthora megakarya]